MDIWLIILLIIVSILIISGLTFIIIFVIKETIHARKYKKILYRSMCKDIQKMNKEMSRRNGTYQSIDGITWYDTND